MDRPLSRLRPVHRAWTGPAFVSAVEPGDGALGVFRDTVVVLRFSEPLEPRHLGQGVRLCDPEGPVPTRLELTPDGRVLTCRPARLLRAGVAHEVEADALYDRHGRPIRPHRSRFTPGQLAFCDVRAYAEEE
jgi:hypothetical protein